MRRRKRPIQSKRTYKDSLPDENLQAGRAGAAEHNVDLFDVHEGVPLVPGELHELARHINSRAIDREEDFIIFDYHLCRLSHARSLIDLCLGELLSVFRKGDGKAYGEMGYSRLDDFACEHLSFSGRLASELILNFERLQALPLTREAYIRGDIVKSALRLLLRVATKENEAELLAGIRRLSVREIDELVKARLKAPKACVGHENMAGGDTAEDATEKTDKVAGDAAEKAGVTGDSTVGSCTVSDAAIADAKAAPGAETSLEAAAVVSRECPEVAPSAAGAGDAVEPGESQQWLIPEEQDSEEIPSEEADREEESGVVMKFSVPRTLALTWDFALEHFRENGRTNGPLYGFVEAMVAAFLDSTADLTASEGPVSDAEAGSDAGSGDCACPDGCTAATFEDTTAHVGGREVPLLHTDAIWDCFPSEREMRAIERDGDLKHQETGAGKTKDSGDEYPDLQNEERLNCLRETLELKPFVVRLPEEYSQIPTDSYALARKIIRVASMRQSLDYHIGWFLKAVHDRHLHQIMEFSKIEDYAKARINISASTTFRLIRLVSYFKNHPVIEKAFLKRKITREQAYFIASLEDGRHEKIWLDFAMSRPTRELREEVCRILRIKEYDYFAPHNYALLPGFRYITDDRYDALSDEMKDILRTGAWYQGPGSQWPLISHDEHYLDKDFADTVTSGSDTFGLSKCAANKLEETDPAESSRLSKCATNPGESSDPADSTQLSKCAASVETESCQCRDGNRQQSDETLEQVRALCTIPDKHRPAATLLLDVLESLAGKNGGDVSSSSTNSGTLALAAGSAEPGVPSASDISDIPDDGSFRSYHREPAMSIRFFLPRGMYGVWNEAVRRYVSLISPDDGVEMLVNNEGVENFIALLLTQYLLTEKAHHKAAHNSKVLERDGYKCQVPGCSNRRNIHAHHLKFRSRGGSDAINNMLCLCSQHHLWVLHILHGLKIEGTAPEELTFTFGPCSSPEGQPFMIYSSGRKVLSPEPKEAGRPR